MQRNEEAKIKSAIMFAAVRERETGRNRSPTDISGGTIIHERVCYKITLQFPLSLQEGTLLSTNQGL